MIVDEMYHLDDIDREWLRKQVPCVSACPVGTPVPDCHEFISRGDFDSAYEANRECNIFPGVLGRICNHPCESVCRRGASDSPVNIRALKRAASDYGLHSKDVQRQDEGKGTKVAVIGAGPAGLSAAIRLVELGYGVTVYEETSSPGGLLTHGVPPYRLPRSIAWRDILEQVERCHIDIRYNARLGENLQLDELLQNHESVLVATGASVAKSLGILGENLRGVTTGLEFMRAIAGGERPDVGDRLVVLGAGHTGVDCARSARRLGTVKDVLVIDCLSPEQVKVSQEEIGGARDEGIRFEFLVSVQNIVPSASGGVAKLNCVRNELRQAATTDGPQELSVKLGSEFSVELDSLIVAIGQTSEDISGLEGKEGLVNRGGSTPLRPRVYLAGDFGGGGGHLVEAVAEGVRAAEAMASQFGRERRPAWLADRQTVSSSKSLWQGRSATTERVEVARLDNSLGYGLDAEVDLGYSRKEAIEEARRCLLCSRFVVVDPSKCVLCGLCVRACAQEAIKLSGLEHVANLPTWAQDGQGQSGLGLLVSDELCTRCGKCVGTCPFDAMTFEPYGALDREAHG